MDLVPILRPMWKIASLLVVLVNLAFGQSELLTEYHHRWLPVVQARLNRPFVKVDGKLRAGDGDRYVLRKADEYLPVFVSIQDIHAETKAIDTGGTLINNEFNFRAGVKSAFALDDVFIVLELETAAAGRKIFLQEIGNLPPRQTRSINVNFHLTAQLGKGEYLVHIFSHGAEVLQSKLGAEYCDNVLDVMTAKRITSVWESPPKLFSGPAPEYPPALFKKKIHGRVVMSVRIGANGRVYDPIVKTTSDPDFTDPALQAVRLWRFLPQVKDGLPVEIRASVPIDFVPPDETGR
jgi:TonB family protein